MEKLTFFLKISAFSLRLEKKRLKGNVLPHILGNIGIINTKKVHFRNIWAKFGVIIGIKNCKKM